jgi:uncharacterized protein YkwD
MSVRFARPDAPVRPTRVRKLTAIGGIAALLFAVAACMPAEERTFLDRTNALRASRGLPALQEHGALTAKAEQWATHLASTGVLAHSKLTEGLGSLAWRSLAENVGVSVPTADTLRSLHDALASSTVHRNNMLSTRFTHMGVGLATGADGRVWVVEVFAQL